MAGYFLIKRMPFTGIRYSLFSFLAVLICFSPIFVSGSPDTALVRTFGGPGSEIGRDIQVTADSGFILVGTTNEYGAGNTSIYLVRTNSSGMHRWSNVLGGSGIDCGYAVRIAPDGGFVICGFSNSVGSGGYDGYLVKTDSLGNELFEKTYGGADWDFLFGMTSLQDSGYVLCGQTYSFTNGNADGYVIRIDKNGDTLWTQHVGGTGDEQFRSVIQINNTLFLCGSTNSPPATDTDGFLVKMDLNGNILYEKSINFIGEDQFNGIAQTISGNLILCGGGFLTDTSKSDIWLQQFDTAGNSVGSNGFSPSVFENDYGNDVAVAGNGDIIMVGQKDPSGLGKKSMFISRNDASTNYKHSASFGSGEDEEGFRCTLTPAGGIAFIGYTTSYGNGNEEMYVVSLSHDTVVDNYDLSINQFNETLSPIGIVELSGFNSAFSIYPNPASQYIYVVNTQGSSPCLFELYTAAGVRVLFKSLESNFDNHLSMDEIGAGIYFYKITDQLEQVFQGKLIIN